jgi:hypothetical protein
MAWVDVPGSNSIYEYENSATASVSHYKDADAGSTVSTTAGIRTYSGIFSTAIYIRCRQKSDSVEIGELSKTYYDNQ